MGIDPVGPRAVFLDRDGVLNRNVFNPELGAFESPLTPEAVEILPGVPAALLALQRSGYLLIVISNQPNVAKGKATLAILDAIHGRVMQSLAGVTFTAVRYCLHHPQGIVPEYSGPCDCRKPSPYFLVEDAKRFGIDLAGSWMIGDRNVDILCGKAAGVRTIRVQEDHPATRYPSDARADFEASGLPAAAAIILAGCRLM
jgi:D-glycero-D-manno-heptose 1,7-bisphosphate phosphatase